MAKTGRWRPLSVSTSNVSSTAKNFFVIGLIKVSTGISMKSVQILVSKVTYERCNKVCCVLTA